MRSLPDPIALKRAAEFNRRFGMPAFSDVCSRCRHFMPERGSDRACSAFTEGIPSEIWLGQNDHSQPYPNDKGIRFEPITSKIAA